MRKILVYANGSKIVSDTDSPDQALINGETPEMVVDATEENIAHYFPSLETPQPQTAIKIK